MTTAQVTFTETELLADHVIAEPLIANGVRCHGGFDEGGNYVSPRTLNRWPAIHAWEEQRVEQFATPILDIPLEMGWEALNIPETSNPVGAKGVGEVAGLAGSAAVLCAIQNAIGSRAVLRTPVTPNRILDAIAAETATPARLTTYA